MIFEKYKDALEYSVSQTLDTRRLHKAVKCMAWRYCRSSGEYSLSQAYTVFLA